MTPAVSGENTNNKNKTATTAKQNISDGNMEQGVGRTLEGRTNPEQKKQRLKNKPVSNKGRDSYATYQ